MEETKNKLRIPKAWQVLLMLPLLAISFQNCGQSFQLDNPSQIVIDEGPKEQSNSDFFGYPYSTKPEFVGEIDLITATKLDSTTYDTAAQGVVVAADSPATPVQFQVRLANSANADVCPAYSGTTAATTQTMISTCIANAWGTVLRVQLLAYSPTGKKWVLVREKTYRGL